MAVHAAHRCTYLHRLLTACTSIRTHSRHREAFVRLVKMSCSSSSSSRTFSTASVRSNENDGQSSDSLKLSPTQTQRQALLLRRKRPLSPLERISSLLPQDALSPEVMQLREQTQQEQREEDPERREPEVVTAAEELETHAGPDAAEEPKAAASHHVERQACPTLHGESLLTFGELLIAEYRKKRRVEFRKMFQLQPGARLLSSWGIIVHDDLVGQPAGRFLKTSRGVPIFFRRASLEDYVLYMKRGPAISYPKDAATMLLMMDVMEGDCVLESGSGSGAMSLLLSRAVGSKGCVLSLEVREDHHRRSVRNYERWRTSWALRRGREWPDNVEFHNADLCTASSLLAGRGFHSVALDMIHPHLALPTVLPHLHPGAVCAVYLANITQVIDLLEGLRCSGVPALCERIVEVPVRDWVVAPALQKDGQYCTRKAPNLAEDPRSEEEMSDGADGGNFRPAFGDVPYIARPHAEQMSHTAFLVKLRKFVQ
ncbi:tRNA (adenine(58)-N(1))-methyltransferase, mitochondrial isoform X2 [Fundulus heteroclitus]|uniref:tRNA (adenine(58)-N(1))-methyltransferase, mitochondrial isoform X2 n=1 Tax=Fundulus heteroclitus TaxID=8078 RepID=UPI00165B9112|nr:tRNA (adenine(58)-N(1))-methyltransferase, mitochondrial isoform X2 [Fundulus heteroclitus]